MTKLDSVLTNFFICNPTFGPREGEEHKKILWYHPISHELDAQVRNIGFCEAIVNFTSTFRDDSPRTYCVDSDKQLQVFYEPEENYIIGMTLKQDSSEEAQRVVLHEKACLSVLQYAYKMFRLFFGTFSSILRTSGGDVEDLKQKLEYFYLRYVPGMRLSAFPLMDVYSGISFMPLDQVNYLKVQSLIGRLKEAFTTVKHTVFLYNDKVLWYSLPRDDMCVLYRYLANNLLPNFLRQELEPSFTHRITGQHYGKFITGPPDLSDMTNLGKVPKIFIQSSPDSTDFIDYQLVIYRALNATLCLLVSPNESLAYQFYKSVDVYLGPLLINIASAVAELYAKLPLDTNHHYIYYNAETKSVRSTFDMDSILAATSSGSESTLTSSSSSSNSRLPPLSPAVLNLLCDLQSEFDSSSYYGDIVVKTEGDLWLAGKKSGLREVMVVVNQKNATLTDVTEEVKKLCSNNFGNMFLMD